MNVEEAERRLEMAEHRKGLWERHLNQANRDCRIAEASRGNNDLHYRLRRQYGDNYMNELREAREHALKEFRCACEEVEKVRADCERAVSETGH